MRKLYFLRDNEEDGAVLDALVSLGMDPDDLENPTCPRCGRELLPAHGTGDDFEVVTWCDLSEEEAEFTANVWYLVCGNFSCDYEEQVERVAQPTGAIIFDIGEAQHAFDDETGLISRCPDELLRLLEQLDNMQRLHPNHKLLCFMDEARWRYEQDMVQVRAWLRQIPPGHRIEFRVGGHKMRGSFVVSTDKGLLVQTDGGDLLAVTAGSLECWGPRFFGPDAEVPAGDQPADSHWIKLVTSDYVIVQGYHLKLGDVDRLGRYRVRCWDAVAARTLGLRQVAGGYWEGEYRRAQIAGRYELRRLLRVRGRWVELYGTTDQEDLLAVRTEEEETANVLGLKPARSWGEVGVPPARRSIAFWYGYVRRNQIEEEQELRLYRWPIREAGGAAC